VLIRPARADDVPTLRSIEVAAGLAFLDLDMAKVAGDEPLPAEVLASFLRAGLAWVVADSADHPVAYLIAEPVDGCLHVEQVSVHPDHARRGLGRRLIDQAALAAAGLGLPALTLTTFVDVPWNGPYYLRCGFRYLTPGQETPGLRAIRAHEAGHGLDAWPRACMRRDLPA
jgi:GNAT superfamily N-acetyltransferase